jgi:hypothetical protein
MYAGQFLSYLFSSENANKDVQIECFYFQIKDYGDKDLSEANPDQLGKWAQISTGKKILTKKKS